MKSAMGKTCRSHALLYYGILVLLLCQCHAKQMPEDIKSYLVSQDGNGFDEFKSIPKSGDDISPYSYSTSTMNKRNLQIAQLAITEGIPFNGEGNLEDRFGSSLALSDDGSFCVIGAIGKNVNVGANNGTGYVMAFMRSGGDASWTQMGQTIYGNNTGDRFGDEVKMSSDGQTIVVGSRNAEGETGRNNPGIVRAYTYDGTGGLWNQLGNDIPGEKGGDLSGVGVAVSSDARIVAIGTGRNDDPSRNNGHVRVYRYDDEMATPPQWVQVGDDINGEAAEDQSGNNIAMSSDGTIVAIGAKFNDGTNGTNTGHVRVYKYNGTAWNQLGSDLDGEAVNDESGFDVAISSAGDIVAIGARFNDGENGTVSNAGHVRVYQLNDDTIPEWVKMGNDIDGQGQNDQSGRNIDISSDGMTLIIGSSFADDGSYNEGAARIYKWVDNANDWIQHGDTIYGLQTADQAGFDVAISGDAGTILVGSRNHDDSADPDNQNSGTARLYQIEKASTGGDPHFNTFAGHHYSYHGQCDLILMECPTFRSGLGLTIHIRTTRIDSLVTSYSYISEAAVRLGDNVLQILSDGQLLVNGIQDSVDIDPDSNEAFVALFQGLSLKKQMTGKKNMIVAYDLDLGMDNAIQIRANLKTNMLFVDVAGTFPNSVGLLGYTDARGLGRGLFSRDGVRDLEGQWNTLGEEWQVGGYETDQKLFLENRSPQYPEGCLYKDRNIEGKKNLRRRLMDELSIGAVTKACANVPSAKKDFCIMDVMLTGDLDLAADPFYQ